MMYATIILAVLLVFQTILFHFERKDLYSRIMCRDLNDYVKTQAPHKDKKTLSAHEKALKEWRERGGSQ